MKIPFNKPYFTGKETLFIEDAVKRNHISGNGYYTKKCHSYFEERYGFKKCLLTTSCTDALEMASILIDIQPGDEVIVPSYTFVSTANAFVLRGAKIIFVDSRSDHPGLDESKIESLITNKTKAIVPVHYAGVSCDMDKIMEIAKKYNLYVVEDAAQSIDSFYIGKDKKRQSLGSIGHFATFSFHETKNVISGEGGMLVVNASEFIERAEIVWEKGTDRSKFFRGEIDKYSWVDIGSSFLMSEINAAFLFAQLMSLDEIQKRRVYLCNYYFQKLKLIEKLGFVRLKVIPDYATNNGHSFYIILKSNDVRDSLLRYLKINGIDAVFHYLSLHKSSFINKNNKNQNIDLPFSDFYSDCILRLPLYYEISESQIDLICKKILNFFE